MSRSMEHTQTHTSQAMHLSNSKCIGLQKIINLQQISKQKEKRTPDLSKSNQSISNFKIFKPVYAIDNNLY